MITLDADIKHRLVNALNDGVAVVVGYVDKNGDPHVSPYGSVHAHSDDQLALWLRNPEGELIAGIARNAKVGVFYAQLSTRTFFRMQGRARVATAVYMVRIAPNTAPMPISRAMVKPTVRMSVVNVVAWVV